MSRIADDIEGFDGEDIWSSSPSGMIDAMERVWQFRWVLALHLAIIAGGAAWLAQKPAIGEPEKTAGTSASDTKAPADLRPSDMRWLSDLGSIGSSYEMMKDSPDIALAMKDVVAARAKIDEKLAPEIAISRAASQIGYVPKVSRGSEIGSETGRIVLGTPEVLSGDTMKIGGHLVTLANAKAPAADDSCTTSGGKAYDCAAWAKQGLTLMLDGAQVSCRVEMASDNGPQAGSCDILGAGFDGERDVAGIGVSSGMLLATADQDGHSPYAALEQRAKTAKLGLWSGDFTPGDMRKTNSE